VHLALFVVVGVACYFALTRNVSLACPLDRPPQDVASCLKSDNWKRLRGYREGPRSAAQR